MYADAFRDTLISKGKSMKKKLVVVGYGGMGGGYHAARALEKGLVELGGIYDTDEKKSELARSRGIFAYPSLEAVCGDETVDLVTVAIPNDSHLPTVLRLLEAGKNVICEKPVALSSADFQKMLGCAEANGRRLFVHQNRRWDVDFLAMKALHDSGEIGRIINIESRIHGSRGIPSDWRGEAKHGGGMLFDWGVHLIDQVLQIYDERLDRVYCTFVHTTNFEVDDGFRLHLYFEGGAEAYIEVGTYNFIALPRFYMQGEKGTALIRDWRENAQVAVCTHWHESEVLPVQNGAGLTKTMAPRDEVTLNCYEAGRPVADVYDFYRNAVDVIDGKAEPLVTNRSVMRVLRVIEAAFESERTGSVVKFEEK